MGKMPCLQISASTTAYGRSMIMQTRELVMATYNKVRGGEYAHGLPCAPKP